MEHPTVNEIINQLEAGWPDWQIWVVNRVVGGPGWCARRWDGDEPALNAGSPDELTEFLEEETCRRDRREARLTGARLRG